MDKKQETYARVMKRRDEADEFSKARNLPLWGVRVVWFVLSEGVEFARAAVAKCNKQHPARAAFQNLLDSGIVSDTLIATDGSKGGVLYKSHPTWEDGDGPLLWVAAVAKFAEGGERHPLL